ncbi:MAG: transcriptional regulator BetI [Hyphomicrobiales bacterium]
MPVRIEDVRREELIRAGLDVLLDGGPEQATMERIGKRAGMSRGIVNYYFRSKDDFMVEIVKRVFADNLRTSDALRSVAKTPRERVSAVIHANFLEPAFTHQLAKSYLLTYARYMSHPDFAVAQVEFDRRTVSDLKEDLRDLIAPEAVDKIAGMALAMMDGFWLERAKHESTRTAAEAIADVEALIDFAIAVHPKKG